MLDLNIFSRNVKRSNSLLAAIRRRLWRYLFLPSQSTLGSFFLDPIDHIGSERLIMGERYEQIYLEQLECLIKLLDLKNGIAIDAGANIGNHSCWFTSQFAHVFSFEPGKIAALVLEANLLKTNTNNWEIFKCALGDKSAFGKLSVIDQVNLGSSQVAIVADNQSEFEVLRGDDVLRNHELAARFPVALMKIDVEGGELSVLQGFQDSIEKDQPLICIEALDEKQWNLINAFLRKCGYVFFMTPTSSHYSGKTNSRITSLLSGIRLGMSEVKEEFPEGGYGMIFCLSNKHLLMLPN